MEVFQRTVNVDKNSMISYHPTLEFKRTSVINIGYEMGTNEVSDVTYRFCVRADLRLCNNNNTNGSMSPTNAEKSLAL